MIIIEGADCVGKTTLCHALLEKLPQHSYSHLGKPPDSFDYLWGYVDRCSDYHVQDRFHLSGLVYAQVVADGRTYPTEWQTIAFESYLTRNSYLTVVLVEDEDTIASRYTEKPEMYDLQTVLRVNEAFLRMPCDLLLSQPHTVGLDECVTEILTMYSCFRPDIFCIGE